MKKMDIGLTTQHSEENSVQLSKLVAQKAPDYLNGYMSKIAIMEGWFYMSLQFTNDGNGTPYFSNSEVNAFLTSWIYC